jgi:hypothetical protein
VMSMARPNLGPTAEVQGGTASDSTNSGVYFGAPPMAKGYTIWERDENRGSSADCARDAATVRGERWL